MTHPEAQPWHDTPGDVQEAFDMSLPQPTGWISRWNQVGRQVRRDLSERYSLAGLSESKAAILEALATRDHQPTQTDLAGDVGLSESNLCGLIERMKNEGLVERDRSPLDRRKSVLSLTPAGQACHQVICGIHADYEAAMQRHLSPEILAEISSVLDLLQSRQVSLGCHPGQQRRSA